MVHDSLNPHNRKEAWLLTLAQLELTTFGGAAVVASVATSKPKAVAMSAVLFSVVCTLWKQESAVDLACTRAQAMHCQAAGVTDTQLSEVARGG